ncbi:MAG TPA: hypothetical protein VF169_18350 [Albitalea sp.]|uniref:hypothetical protein n=1 Tax=Piscinibacter sp. TaxID=1903157 RepID=UPI002ED32357
MALRTWLALLLAGIAGSSWANRPLNTDTADTIAHHRCQFEPFVAVDRAQGMSAQHTSTLQLNCGVSGSTQLGVAYSRRTSDEGREEVLGLGGKTNLVELADDRTGVAVNYTIAAARDSESGWRHETTAATLIATRQLRPDLLGHLNLGWSRSRADAQDSTTWAAALEWSLTPRVVLSAEAYGTDRTRAWLGAGVWCAIHDRFSVNVSHGVQRASPRVRQTTAGFNFEF